MSVFSTNNNVKLGELIAYLKTLPPDQRVKHGFTDPHSYRGYYEDLAFEPCEETTVGAMLAAAESALGGVFQGYKGGQYKMTEHTDCWLAEYGNVGVPIVAPGTESTIYVLPKSPQEGDNG